jgi:hypothetical protein
LNEYGEDSSESLDDELALDSAKASANDDTSKKKLNEVFDEKSDKNEIDIDEDGDEAGTSLGSK